MSQPATKAAPSQPAHEDFEQWMAHRYAPPRPEITMRTNLNSVASTDEVVALHLEKRAKIEKRGQAIRDLAIIAQSGMVILGVIASSAQFLKHISLTSLTKLSFLVTTIGVAGLLARKITKAAFSYYAKIKLNRFDNQAGKELKEIEPEKLAQALALRNVMEQSTALKVIGSVDPGKAADILARIKSMS